MITVFLCTHRSQKLGQPDLSPQKPLIHVGGVKKINCIVNFPISYARGIPTDKKKLAILATAGIRTIEDLFKATEETLSVLKDESFFGTIHTAWENIQKHTYIYKESMKIPGHLLLQWKIKNTEEKLIHLGVTIFDPIFKTKKIARNALIEKIPKPAISRIEKRKMSGIIRNFRQLKYRNVG